MLQADMAINDRHRQGRHLRHFSFVPYTTLFRASNFIRSPRARECSGKEVIRLTPDATGGHGHRRAPPARSPFAVALLRFVAADVSRLKPHPQPASKGMLR